MNVGVFFFFFFFKQKTAYEIRPCDWSSDVCSSDLVTQGAATRAIAKETNSVPIVYVFSADPVLAGIAQSLARPGGNATGITLMSVELNGKRIELLREILPRLRRVTIIANPAHSGAEFELQACESAGRQLGVAIHQ